MTQRTLHRADAEQPSVENTLLYWRKKRKVSLEELSTRLETSGRHYASARTLNRWEKGESALPPWAVTDLAQILRISEDELLYGPREGDPALAVNVSGAYTGLDLEIAEHVIGMGYTSWMASQPEEALRAAESVLPWLEALEALQRRAPRSAQAQHGKPLLARGYELLGALALDRLDNAAATSRFRQALTLSEELHDSNLLVAHMTELGDAYRRSGDTETALALMEAARSRAGSAERATYGYVLEMLAYTYADAGDEQAFARHIAAATDTLGHSGEGQGAARRDFVPFEVLEIHGKALRDFGHPVQALEYFERAERALLDRPNVPRWHAALMISKAQALCDAGELEAGVTLATRGLLLAHTCQSPRQMNRVRKLLDKLNTSPLAAAPALALLRDLLAEIYQGKRSPVEWRPKHTM